MNTPTETTTAAAGPYVSAEATAALIDAIGLSADVLLEHTSAGGTLTVRHVIDEPHHAPGQLYIAELDGADLDELSLKFHRGNPADVGYTGWTNEALLAVLIHRLGILDERVPSAENKTALHHLRHATMALESRTNGRQARGVAGTQEL